MDLFLVHAYLDHEYASGLEDTRSGRGLGGRATAAHDRANLPHDPVHGGRP